MVGRRTWWVTCGRHTSSYRWGSRRGWERELATNGSDLRRAPPRRRAQPLERSKANHGAGERAVPRVSTWWVLDGEGSVVEGKLTNGDDGDDNEIVSIIGMRARAFHRYPPPPPLVEALLLGDDRVRALL